MAEILVIDDDLIFCEIMQEQLAKLGHDCDTVSNLHEGIARAGDYAYDLIFLDVTLPDGNGLKEIQAFRQAHSQPEIVIITGYGDAEGAEVALKNGAWDYIQKPATVNTIKLTISRALRYRMSRANSDHFQKIDRESIVGNGPRIKECLELVAQAAASNINVLITGETGTGKEVFAKAIHMNSNRANNPFIVADCTSIPETLAESLLFGHQKGSFTGATASNAGLFLQANQGTLFLDEIGDLSLPVQKSFLRVLQEKKFRPLGSKEEKASRFRLVSATNRSLENMISEGVFRKDLYYRLRTMNIHLPPLRERRDDIPTLLDYYVPRVCEELDINPKKISQEFVDACLSYDWPGNVRELVNTVNIACSSALEEDTLYTYHMPVDIRVHMTKLNMRNPRPESTPPPPAAAGAAENMASYWCGRSADRYPTYKDARRKVVDSMETRYLRELLNVTRRDFKKACQVSGLSRARLYELLKKHNISVKHF